MQALPKPSGLNLPPRIYPNPHHCDDHLIQTTQVDLTFQQISVMGLKTHFLLTEKL